ncbi:Gfo/Idh/MocA family oxidoreductase [Fodinisporobacter ferrooxydans]|uniref:Gfo/Idh/MocA family oxidoreductase n=1 Tax=Fodinisporobacter ferrooxydans TaxID=2901836 RepID=A0ABY4CGH2_9BACL|nr:Gfo/Idh/MocA family oxidoreductase [Alicyclobacillaceae bacterium MYW30-H2]
MIKVAVVGVNKIGLRHCEAYRQNQDAKIVAVCDLLPERASSAAVQYGAKAYTDVRKLLENEEIDIVSIATAGPENGGHHFEPTMLAIKAGKNVLVEKPLSNTIEEAREMVAVARQHKARLACNLNHRFVPAAYKGKELIQNGVLGQILFANMKLTIKNPSETGPWIHLRALHPHSIDVIRYFAGDIKRVQTFMTKAPGRSIWSTASINLEFTSGAVGHLTGSYDMSNFHPIEYCEVAGDKGRFVIENIYDNFTFYPHNSNEQLVIRNPVLGNSINFLDTFKNRLNEFVKQVKEGVPADKITGSGEDALAAQEVIEAAIRSQMTNGAVVEVPNTVE